MLCFGSIRVEGDSELRTVVVIRVDGVRVRCM